MTESGPDPFAALRGTSTAEPAHRDVAEVLGTGHRALRRRRLGVVAGVAAALAVAGATGMVAVADSPDPAPPVAADTPLPAGNGSGEATAADAKLRATCRDDDSTLPKGERALFDNGATTRFDQITATGRFALFTSADGAYVGLCEVTEGASDDSVTVEGDATLRVYRVGDPVHPALNVEPPGRGISMCLTPAMKRDGTCRVYSLLATRLPADVARVDLTFADGQQASARTEDGWILMAHEYTGGRHESGLPEVYRFYDADGSLLAQTGGHPPAGVPGVRAYPEQVDTFGDDFANL